MASLKHTRFELYVSLAWLEECFLDFNHLIIHRIVIVSIALKNKDSKKFFTKNCIHAKIIKNVAMDIKIVSTIFTNLNFDVVVLLTIIKH